MTASTYLVDYPQRRLVPLEPTAAASPLEPQAVDGTVAGHAFRLVEALPGHEGDGRHHLWLPIVDGVERLGVVHVGLPVGMRIDDGPIRDQLRWLAHLAGHIIASKSPYGDKFHRVRTAQDRTVASELIWSLLPPLTVATDGLVISGLLEPAHWVAGDVLTTPSRTMSPTLPSWTRPAMTSDPESLARSRWPRIETVADDNFRCKPRWSWSMRHCWRWIAFPRDRHLWAARAVHRGLPLHERRASFTLAATRR